MPAPARSAYTLVDMLIVIAIMGILISLLLPAVQAAREAARRRKCANHLAQLALAVAHYESVHATLPPGTIDAKGPIASRAVGYHMNWISQILPYLEESNLHHAIDFSLSAYDPQNSDVRKVALPILTCPTASGAGTRGIGESHYAGCHHDVESPIDADNHGAFFLNSFVGYDDIADGRAQTIFLGEKFPAPGGTGRINIGDLGWLSGTRAVLRNTGTPINATSRPGGPLEQMLPVGAIEPQPKPDPPRAITLGMPANDAGQDGPSPWEKSWNQPDLTEYQPGIVPSGVTPALVVGGFESAHPLGAQFTFGDGSVRYLSEEIDGIVYRRLGHRADGELVDDSHFMIMKSQITRHGLCDDRRVLHSR
jgi:competence protein ComGC